MALIIVSLLVLVPLALLSWDLVRSTRSAHRERVAQNVAANVPAHVNHS